MSLSMDGDECQWHYDGYIWHDLRSTLYYIALSWKARRGIQYKKLMSTTLLRFVVT